MKKEKLSVNYPFRITPSMAAGIKKHKIKVGDKIRPVIAKEIKLLDSKEKEGE